MAGELPGPWARRPISIGTLLVLTVLVPFVAPIGLVLGLIVDAATRTWGFRRTRTVALLSGLVLVDFVGFVFVLLGWLFAPLGFRMQSPRMQSWYRWVMAKWTAALMFVITKCCPITLQWEGLDEDILAPNAIVIGRHRSLLDAILPAVIFGSRGHTPLYTLKEDLRWEPNIDIVGHTMRHRFVTRAPKNLEAELEPIRELGGRVDDSSVAVIFPEGTFFTERRKQRIVSTLERRNPAHAAIASSLNYLLAPRPGGTMALLDGAPKSDVIFFVHAGFEAYGTIKEILASVGERTVVTMKAWRIPYTEIPTDARARVDWLFDRWAELDEWITATHRAAHAQ